MARSPSEPRQLKVKTQFKHKKTVSHYYIDAHRSLSRKSNFIARGVSVTRGWHCYVWAEPRNFLSRNFIQFMDNWNYICWLSRVSFRDRIFIITICFRWKTRQKTKMRVEHAVQKLNGIMNCNLIVDFCLHSAQWHKRSTAAQQQHSANVKRNEFLYFMCKNINKLTNRIVSCFFHEPTQSYTSFELINSFFLFFKTK